MADILPEPKDIPQPGPVNSRLRRQSSMNRQTFIVLIGLVIIAILAILGGYIYDVVSNHHDDNTRKQDLSYIAGTLNNYYALNQSYPTLSQLNSSTFSAFAPSLNYVKFKDPSSTSVKLVSNPTASNYAYEVSPANCNNTSIKCSGFKLVATLSNGSQYIVLSPAHK